LLLGINDNASKHTRKAYLQSAILHVCAFIHLQESQECTFCIYQLFTLIIL